MKKTALVVTFLLAINFARAQEAIPSADMIMTAAYKQAVTEKKHVLVIFHASWCGWCRKMDASLNDEKTKKYFDDHYVTVHLTVEESKDKKNLENPGAEELKKKHLGEKAGLPFWLVMDSAGKLVGDSYIRKEGISAEKPGENIGCPGSAEEVAAFINILKKTSSLTDAELGIIAERFKKNAPAAK